MSEKFDQKSITLGRKILVISFLLFNVPVGLIAAIIAIGNFDNYYDPYLFGLISGSIGLIVGVIIAKKLKPLFSVTRKLQFEYGGAILMVSFGFIGFSMLLFEQLNQCISTVKECENYVVTDKYYLERKGRYSVSQILLYVDMNGKTEELRCTLPYWETIAIGKHIKVCKQTSAIGFDYLELPDEIRLR